MPPGTVIDETLTILPLRASFIAGATALQQSQVPRTFTSNIRSHSATVSWSHGFFTMLAKIAALLTRASIRPKRSSVAAANASVDASSDTSTSKPIAVPSLDPISAATGPGSSTSPTTTDQPSAARASA